jgi:hypothetical protein
VAAISVPGWFPSSFQLRLNLSEFALLFLGHNMLSLKLFRLRLSDRGHFVEVEGSTNKSCQTLDPVAKSEVNLKAPALQL